MFRHFNNSPFRANVANGMNRWHMWNDPRVWFPIITVIGVLADVAQITQALGH